jgi:hypothetical protein
MYRDFTESEKVRFCTSPCPNARRSEIRRVQRIRHPAHFTGRRRQELAEARRSLHSSAMRRDAEADLSKRRLNGPPRAGLFGLNAINSLNPSSGNHLNWRVGHIKRTQSWSNWLHYPDGGELAVGPPACQPAAASASRDLEQVQSARGEH